jgi:RNA polymerase sigma factor (sigma-70 family)
VFVAFSRDIHAGALAVPADGQTLRSILTQIVRRVFNTHARRQLRRQLHDRYLLRRQASTVQSTAAEETEYQERVYYLLERLTSLEREILLKRLDGFTQAEISIELMVSEKTVYRALRKVRALLVASFPPTDPGEAT